MRRVTGANHRHRGVQQVARQPGVLALLLIAVLVCAAAAPVLAENVNNVYAWGYNVAGELGNGTTTESFVPVEASALSNVTAVACGAYHSLALKSDGTVWAWGYNIDGELGNGTTTESHVPIEVTSLFNVTAIAAGAYHSLALKSDGTVWAWGYNGDGELGNGMIGSSNVPVEVSDLSNVTAIASSAGHSLALKTDGSVWAWGINNAGELGNGTQTDSSVPVEVSGLSNVTAVSGGDGHSLALKTDGTVWAWGFNYYGELGNGTTTGSRVPVEVSGLSNVTAIAAGGFHSLALKTDGTMWAWGDNGYGQLGNGTRTPSSVPVAVSGLSFVAAIAGGNDYSLALKTDGTVWTWGYNSYGQLGDGTITSRSAPVEVSGLSNVSAIAGGVLHSLAVAGDMTAPTTTASLSGRVGQNGWYTGPVTVTLSATDPDDPSSSLVTSYALDGGAQQTYTAPFTVSGDGKHTLSFFSMDPAGVHEAPQSLTIPIDSTPPTLSFGAPSPAPNAAGWNNSTVTISYTTADNVSGVASAVPGRPLSFMAEGKNQRQGVKVTDAAGNSASFTSPMVSIDLTPPVTTAALAGPLGADGISYTGSVKVTLSATDTLSGVDSTYYTVDGGAQQTYTQPFTVATDGSHAIRYWSVDVAGSAEPTHTANITIDSTPPTVSFGALSPAPNAAGWNNSAVTIPFTTADAVSGVASSSPASPLQFSTEGKIQTQSVTVTDNAGNSATFTSPAVNIDLTPPVTTLSFSGPAGADSSSFTGPVQVKLSAADKLSGVSATYYTLGGSPQQTYTQPFTISADGAHAIKYWSVDVAGNVETAHNQKALVDTSLPAITITAPANQTYLLNQVVNASYSAVDNTDGIVSVSVPVPSGSPIDTASVGTKTFTVKASDTAGNSSEASVSYTVSYGVKLLYEPTIAAAPGQPLAILLQLVDASGANVSSANIPVRAVSITGMDAPASPGTGTGPAFTFDPMLEHTGGYVFNLNTKDLPAGSLNLNFIAGSDPTVHQAAFTSSGPTATVPKGISMVSVPFANSGDLAALFGVQVFQDGSADVATYDPVSNQYLLYPHLPGTDGKSGLPGRGYWVEESVAKQVQSTVSANPSPLDVTLSPGWNMIGDPYPFPMPVASLQVIASAPVGGTAAGTPVNFNAAITAGLIGSTVWKWDNASGQYAAATTLEPYNGYWVYVTSAAGQSITLRFTNPGFNPVPQPAG